uniref:Protein DETOXIFICATION n=1 Tax=Oryza glumipatula TaxID=40148 RepID=A0A0E0B9A7_9ORYZ
MDKPAAEEEAPLLGALANHKRRRWRRAACCRTSSRSMVPVMFVGRRLPRLVAHQCHRLPPSPKYWSNTLLAYKKCLISAIFLVDFDHEFGAFGAGRHCLLGVHKQRAMAVLALACVPVRRVRQGQRQRDPPVCVGQDADIAAEAGANARWTILSLVPYVPLVCHILFLQAQSVVVPVMASFAATAICHVAVCWALVFKAPMGSRGPALSIAILYCMSASTSPCLLSMSGSQLQGDMDGVLHGCVQGWPAVGRRSSGRGGLTAGRRCGDGDVVADTREKGRAAAGRGGVSGRRARLLELLLLVPDCSHNAADADYLTALPNPYLIAKLSAYRPHHLPPPRSTITRKLGERLATLTLADTVELVCMLNSVAVASALANSTAGNSNIAAPTHARGDGRHRDGEDLWRQQRRSALRYIHAAISTGHATMMLSTSLLKKRTQLSEVAYHHTFMEWWSFELLVLLCGLLPNPKLETSSLNTGSLMFMVPFGLCTAISTRVSNELGAGKP